MLIAENRKRKQQEDKLLSSSMPTNTSSWSDFIYSSPSSPSMENNESNSHHFNFDSLFEQHSLQFDHNNTTPSGTNSRRHSVAVGEMDYHSFDFSKHEVNILPTNGNESGAWDDLQRLLTNPSSLCLPHQQHPDRPIHKRTMSLREDDPHYATLLSPTLSTTSSSTFFSASFLDALVAGNALGKGNTINDDATVVSDMSFMDSSKSTTNDLFSQSADLLKLASGDLDQTNTVTPSAIASEISTMADWLLEQQEVKEMHTQAQKRQRRSTSSLSPASPTHTMGSSLSSLSPSPPITPMQPASLGFEPILFQQQQQQQQQQNAQSDDWDLNLLDTSNNNSTSNNKNGVVSTRMLQGGCNAPSLKPMIQEYLVCREHQDRSVPVAGERTVMVLTSRVAQKSYGTEKRFLCPPPTTILKGANWWTNGADKPSSSSLTEPTKSNFFQSQSVVLSPPKLTIHISGETINQTGVIEWQTSSGTIVDTAVASNGANMFGRCVSKQLYINDADEKRKRVEVLAKIQLGNNLPLGTFPSKGIKVISKPSKKRQSIKNMELCIHHGTTISLFNRIRSQTVSTKYLGVSNGSSPASSSTSSSSSTNNNTNNGTCFVARTGSWDPFVVWIVDTTRSPDTTSMPRPNQHHSNPNFPPPPAIALQTPSSTQQPVAIHYNQPVVLQCVTSGLVSPVMVIRKVDKGSMVLGGNRMDDFTGKTGGECGDETLGDPVSQLHKVAFQIVQDPTFSHHNKTARYQPPGLKQPNYEIPQSCHPVTYLACLNDVVGMHKTNYNRHLIPSCQQTKTAENNWTGLMQENNKLFDNETEAPVQSKARRRMSSISSTETKGRRGSLADRRGSSVSDSSGLEGACWTEDVSDAAVWTIVGTDCASYTFWTPFVEQSSQFNMPFNHGGQSNSAPITPFPVLHDLSTQNDQLTLLGENLSRGLSVWFGDIKANTEFKSRDSMTCNIPDAQELLNSPTLLIEEDGIKKKIPLLLVRGDGVVYRTDHYYTL